MRTFTAGTKRVSVYPAKEPRAPVVYLNTFAGEEAKILEALEADRDRAEYVGDSEVDIQTAKNAGLACISVDWGFRSHDSLIQSGAKLIVSSPEELCRILTEEA